MRSRQTARLSNSGWQFNRLRRVLPLLIVFVLPVSHAAEQAGYDELIQLSLQQRNAGDFAAAEASLRRAAPMASQTNEVGYLLGMVIAFQERFDEAMNVLDAELQRYPDDTQLLLAKARVHTYQSQFVEAGEITDQLLENEPQNLEALNLRANIYRYQQRYSAARETYSAVLGMDEENLESMIGLHDTEVGAGNLESADAWLYRAAASYPDHIDVTSRQDRRVSSSQRNSFTVGTAQSSFDTAFLNRWYDRFLEYRHETDSGTQIFLRGEHAHRFNAHDSMLEIGGLFLLPRRGYLEIAVGGTEDTDFLPENRVRLNGGFNLLQAGDNFGATSLGFSAMRSRYITGNVSALGLNLTHYLLSTNAWITPGIGFIENERGDTTLNWQIGGHWQVTGNSRLGYTYYNSPETENSFTTDARTHHLYGNFQLNDSLSIRLDLSRHDRKNSYTRDSIGLSLNLRY